MYHLLQEMDKAFLQFKTQNESKNVFKSTRTAGIYSSIVVIMYFLSAVFGFTGLYLLSNICNFIMCICILTLMLLAYIRYMKSFIITFFQFFNWLQLLFYHCRYSGNYNTIGVVIDEVANTLWNNVSNVYLIIYL